jgi:hypothetical protein
MFTIMPLMDTAHTLTGAHRMGVCNNNMLTGIFVHRTEEYTADLNIYCQGLYNLYCSLRGPLMVAQWLRYCATNQKVTGSIPDGVIGIFH